MGREPSDATKLRQVRRLLKSVEKGRQEAMEQREHYRVRATKAEYEVGEWKRRFDALLSRLERLERQQGPDPVVREG